MVKIKCKASKRFKWQNEQENFTAYLMDNNGSCSLSKSIGQVKPSSYGNV